MQGNKVSTLRCEPYFADNSDCDDDYYGLDYPFKFTLWRIFVDEVCITQTALPFVPADDVVQVSVSKCIPIFGDGGTYVTARRFADNVLWFGFHPASSFDFDDSPLPVEVIYLFRSTEYIQAIQQAVNELTYPSPFKEVKPSLLRKILNRIHESVDNQPEIKPIPTLTSQELKAILRHLFSRDLDLPLYRMPEHPDDFRGASLFRAVWDAINLQELRVVDMPQHIIEVHIGLDTKEFMESVWQVGKVGDDIAILFVAEPHFPLWLSGFKSIEKWITELQ